jgi:phosphoenolpyruvate-protein phosphotransferase
MKRWTGIGASAGIVIGPVWIFRTTAIQTPHYTIRDVNSEMARLTAAITAVRKQIQAQQAHAVAEVGEKEAAIFSAHLSFLEDPELMEAIQNAIREDKLNAEAAVEQAAQVFAELLAGLDDPYFRERAQDVHAVGDQIVRSLLGKTDTSGRGPAHPAIVVAEELTPADTIQFNRSILLGLVTVRGGPTSHVAILSRSLGIPSIVSVPLAIDEVHNGETAILDGVKGELILSPDAAALAEAHARRETFLVTERREKEAAQEATHTLDGQRVEVVANIGTPEDAVKAIEFGAEGVGLFRTEFLYMGHDALMSEAEQVSVYRQVFDTMGSRPVVVRTLDIGGDKEIKYLGLAPEENPFLGWRGIRMISERVDLLEGQFRALLRAGVNADLRIMLPMVSNLDEIERGREILEKVRRQLENEGVQYARKVQYGIMVEVPSIALIAEHAAPLVDFFSIGTNDLTQYTLAVDRGNSRVAPLASPFHPAVLQLIARTIHAGHAVNKWVGMCGEFAGNTLAAPLLLGLGLDEFSASASMLPALKQTLRQCKTEACHPLANELLQLGRPEAVIARLKEFSRGLQAG